MSDSDAYTLEIKGLNQLLKALKSVRPPVIRIGIIGAKAGPHFAIAKPGQKAPKSAPTNAEIGAAHEFGAPTRGLPQRSFLRVPLADRLNKEMELSGALSEATTKDVIKEGSVVPYLKKIAVMAEGIVAGAFDSGGYGKWPAWKNSNYHNNANQLLVDTGQLRNSITSEVKET